MTSPGLFEARARYLRARQTYTTVIEHRLATLVRRQWPTAATIGIHLRGTWRYDPTTDRIRHVETATVTDIRDPALTVLLATYRPPEQLSPADRRLLTAIDQYLTLLVTDLGARYWPDYPAPNAYVDDQIVIHPLLDPNDRRTTATGRTGR